MGERGEGWDEVPENVVRVDFAPKGPMRPGADPVIALVCKDGTVWQARGGRFTGATFHQVDDARQATLDLLDSRGVV
jgi:hypothetical protein